MKRKSILFPIIVLIGFLFLNIVSFAKSDKVSLPPPKHDGVYVIAHRGFHQGYPENTLIAYQKAIELGVDFIEIDLRTTADGEIVSLHNSKVDDYTHEAKGTVSQFTLDDLKQIDIGSRVNPKFVDQRIPTLDEILELCKGKVGLYIDMKYADPQKVINKLDKYDMKYRVVWYAGPKDIKIIREQCSDCFIMPDPGSEKHLENILKKYSPPVVASDFDSCSESFVRTCHKYGALVFIDDGGPTSWEESLRWGVDGIQTDYPDQLIEFLNKRFQEKK